MTRNSNPFLEVFRDPEQAARYSDGPAKFMPGFTDVHRMASVLIRETAPRDARVVVHGAGGGLELEAFARENPEWRLLGVDPAEPMLAAAKDRLGSLVERVELQLGYAEDLPTGPFDAATSLLTLHFLDAKERRRTAAELVRRLKPGSPLIVAHCSFPQGESEREQWLNRYREFAVASGADPEMAESARSAVSKSVPVFDPERDAQILRDAGLEGVTTFYSAFTWHGWVGYRR